MNIYVYICIHTYVQTLVNVSINVCLSNTYVCISTYIYICICTYCCSEFQCVAVYWTCVAGRVAGRAQSSACCRLWYKVCRW